MTAEYAAEVIREETAPADKGLAELGGGAVEGRGGLGSAETAEGAREVPHRARQVGNIAGLVEALDRVLVEREGFVEIAMDRFERGGR